MTSRQVFSQKDLSISARTYFFDELVVISDGLMPYFDHILKLKHWIGLHGGLYGFDSLDPHNYLWNLL